MWMTSTSAGSQTLATRKMSLIFSCLCGRGGVVTGRAMTFLLVHSGNPSEQEKWRLNHQGASFKVTGKSAGGEVRCLCDDEFVLSSFPFTFGGYCTRHVQIQPIDFSIMHWDANTNSRSKESSTARRLQGTQAVQAVVLTGAPPRPQSRVRKQCVEYNQQL